METNHDILLKVKEKFPSLINFAKEEIVENILCLPCHVSNNANYFILYPTGEIKYKTKDHWEYTSAFNKDGFGNGIAFIDLTSYELIKVYYYKDDLNFDDPIRIAYSSKNFLITEHEERTHIIFLDNFSVSSFGGWEYKVCEPYILFFPHSGYSCYNTFAIIDTNTKKRIDLGNKLSNIIAGDLYNKEIGNFFESSITIDAGRENLVYQYQHSGETFEINLEKLFTDNELLEYSKSIQKPQINYHNLQVIEGHWTKGFALDIHTIKSSFNTDGSFDTERSFIGELLYKIKYRFDKTKIKELVEIIASEFSRLFTNPIDVIIPIPPSNMNRPFQPLIEIAKELSNKIHIPLDSKLVVKKKITSAIKQIEDYEKRKELLADAFFITDKSYKGKTVLLFDDLYRSGETLNAVTKVLKEQGEVGDIYVLTITRTRTKK